MTDDKTLQLIIKAQEGDIESANLVVYSHRHLAKSIARSYFLIGADADDVMQIGMMGLFRAVMTYKLDSGATFKTYASNCIRNIILDEIRRSKPNAMDIIPIDDVLDKCHQNTPESTFIEKESEQVLIESITSLLKPLEMDVLKLHVQSMSYQEIAEQLGIEKKKVDNTIYAIRKKLKKFNK